jgi:hypothetical protein
MHSFPIAWKQKRPRDSTQARNPLHQLCKKYSPQYTWHCAGQKQHSHVVKQQKLCPEVLEHTNGWLCKGTSGLHMHRTQNDHRQSTRCAIVHALYCSVLYGEGKSGRRSTTLSTRIRTGGPFAEVSSSNTTQPPQRAKHAPNVLHT